jgi:hypothetical protein
MDYPSIIEKTEPIKPYGETGMTVRAILNKVSVKLAKPTYFCQGKTTLQVKCSAAGK